MGKVLIKCDTCGKEFFKYSSKIGKNNFCCRDCYNKFHSKNVKKYTCEICGKIFTGAKANGITLCKECHIKVHQKYGWTSNIKMTPDFLKKPGQK